MLVEVDIDIVNNKKIVSKQLENKGLHLNTYGNAQLALNFKEIIRKL